MNERLTTRTALVLWVCTKIQIRTSIQRAKMTFCALLCFKGPSINDVGNYKGGVRGQKSVRNCLRMVLKKCRQKGRGVSKPRKNCRRSLWILCFCKTFHRGRRRRGKFKSLIMSCSTKSIRNQLLPKIKRSFSRSMRPNFGFHLVFKSFH